MRRWPNRAEVDSALRQWVADFAPELVTVLALGYFGSYARDEAGLGSDLDVVMIVTESDLPFHQRSGSWNFLAIPVPVEALVYTWVEWQQLASRQPRFYQTLLRETVWIKPLENNRGY
ncbi:MAG: nucleotidyltransferase domain-containing protein [Leptolyngbyaceae cyanobacterium SM2_5_2]|nr:nucleotidyltransferase domain-containing protein [Leptolyngbyaceae cyanobacterium SM2_5_2]